MPSGFQIRSYPFDAPHKQVVGLDSHPLGRDWPVVYLIHNTKELYIGETSNAMARMSNHLENQRRKNLTEVKIIFDKEYNKSAILDIEQSLIHLCSVDGTFQLQNRNAGQSKKHNYYQREKYLNKVDEIWQQLYKMRMASKTILDIRNSDCYKYSPYHSLTEEQNAICMATMNDIMDHLLNGQRGATIIQGTAGTGKSVVLMNMLFQLVNAHSFSVDFSEEDEDLTEYQEIQHKVVEYLQKAGKKELKVAYVIAMTSFRATIKEVFRLTKNGLRANMVIGPSELSVSDTVEQYDVIFVDEAHRLAQRKNISYMGAFDAKCKELFGPNVDPRDYTQLDWILACSKNVVLIYDHNQHVAGSDITLDQIANSIAPFNPSRRRLTTQMRCAGGQEFAHYVKEILDATCTQRLAMADYDFRLYEDVSDMVRDIKEKEKEHKLCRVAAGYAWEWKSKGIKTPEEVIRLGKEDIEINGHRYIWNMSAQGWILGENAINEIGCIHTTQGYDLNYAGIILGREIDYDPNKDEIVINPKLFFDKKAKNGTTPEQLKNYIVNAYRTMMLRGIKGCYVYACNPNLRAYLAQFISVVSASETKTVTPLSSILSQDEEDDNHKQLLQLDEIADHTLLHQRYIPVFDFKMACGAMEDGENIQTMSENGIEKGWVDAEMIGCRANENMFIVQAKGDSMLDKIHSGDLCLFERYTNTNAGSRNGDIVLAKQPNKDSDYRCNYTIKKYTSEKMIHEDGTWEHAQIILQPLNPAYNPIVLSPDDEVSVIARFVRVI